MTAEEAFRTAKTQWGKKADKEQERIRLYSAWSATWLQQINASPAQRAHADFVLAKSRSKADEYAEGYEDRIARIDESMEYYLRLWSSTSHR